MRSIALLLIAVFLAPSRVAAEDGPEGPEPLSDEQAADAVQAAVQASQIDELKKLAGSDDPDPWRVVEELCFRRAYDVAKAFAQAAPRADIEKLPDYVEACRKRGPDEPGRKLLDAMSAALTEDALKRVIEGTASLDPKPDTVTRIRLAHARGLALRGDNQLKESEGVLRSAAEATRTLGWLSRAAWIEDDADIAKASTLSDTGRDHLSRREYESALKAYAGVLEIWNRLGESEDIAAAHSDIGNVHWKRRGHGDYEQALTNYQAARELMKSVHDKPGVARMDNNIGRVYQAQGVFDRAGRRYGMALEERRANGDTAGVATTLGNMGLLHFDLGEYAAALQVLHDAKSKTEGLQDPNARATGMAEILSHIGSVHQWLGDSETALNQFKLAREKMKEVGNGAGEAATLANLGTVYWSLKRYDEALKAYEDALRQLKPLKIKAQMAEIHGNIGVVLDSQGHYKKALDQYKLALIDKEALGDRAGEAMTLANIGEVHQHLGDAEAAQESFEESLSVSESGHAKVQEVTALAMLARLHWETKEHSDALASAKAALKIMEETLLSALGDEHGASAREKQSIVFAIGALAATAKKKKGEAFRFLESGRAGALLDMLGKSETLRRTVENLPEELRLEHDGLQLAEKEARMAYDRAVESKDREKTSAASDALEKARENVAHMAGRIQSAWKLADPLFSVRSAPLKNLRKELDADQALVLYGLFRDDTGPPKNHIDQAVALVVRRDSVRPVPLGKASVIEDACRPLTPNGSSARNRGLVESLDSPPEKRNDWVSAVKTAQDLLVKPLKLDELEEGEKPVKQVLVSPDGVLGYVPFSLLIDDRTVAMTPSGTTHLTLLKRADKRAGEKGRGILALGNPDYAGSSDGARAIYYQGRTPAPLPATLAEVEKISTKTLAGKDASEAALYQALPTQEHWRAIHFACHGFVNVEHPMLSSLALSKNAGDDADGFLTALEVMRTEMPTDLAVLSACETAVGKIVQGEGVMGFTRAFLFAGAPRVICSLWPVDDKATAALMVKFYELWNPKSGEGLGAAEALKRAQAFVRDQKKWEDPRFWAAWTLWGLPN